MMAVMLRLTALITLTTIWQAVEGRRLLLGEDGFARVDGTPESPEVTGITVSSWVNITNFPGGVAPLVTLISEDATYQIAFFMRHDGAGVLWGGPVKTTNPPPVKHVDRQPRSKYGFGRKRRSAVDYSMGLGDVMNIMGTRKERSNTWTPMNFVDVSEMGVADLETSGSETSNHYENWHDVGYELQMQESADPDPKILTNPSGDNDFVVINWDGQDLPGQSFNRWDPLNKGFQSPKPSSTRIRAPDNEKFVWSQEENNGDNGWTSQVIPASLGTSGTENKKSRYNEGFALVNTRTRKTPTRLQVPLIPRPGSVDEKPSYENFRFSTNRRQPTTTTTTTTTTVKPRFLSKEIGKNSQESRVPLWARLKKTVSEEKIVETTTARPVTRAYTSTLRPSKATTFRRTTLAQKKKTNAYTTMRPKTTLSQKIKNIRSQNRNDIKSIKNYSTHRKHSSTRKPYASPYKPHKPLASHSLDEFKRVLEGKPTVKDNGNKVVVYSMPITDVDAFNRMYEQYQEAEAQNNPRISLHAVYEQASEGDYSAINEEETNDNRLEQISEPLPVLTYKEEPLHYAKNEPETVIVDGESIIVPTQEDNIVVKIEENPVNEEDYTVIETDYPAYYSYVDGSKDYQATIYQDDSQFPSQFSPIQSQAHYDIIIPAEQDIGGQRPGFYQESPQISHQQLPPQYTEKPTKIPLIITTPKPVAENVNQFEHAYAASAINQAPPPIPSPVVQVPKPIVSRYGAQNQPQNKPTEVPVTEKQQENVVPTTTPEVPLNVNFRKMPYNFDVNTWYHITFAWKSQDKVLRIYINGELAGIVDDAILDRDALPTSGMMLLGKTLLPSLTGFDPTSHLTGEMSNFVVWGDALSDAEVRNVFSCGASPIHPVLLAWNATPLRVYNDASVQQAPPICGLSS